MVRDAMWLTRHLAVVSSGPASDRTPETSLEAAGTTALAADAAAAENLSGVPAAASVAASPAPLIERSAVQGAPVGAVSRVRLPRAAGLAGGRGIPNALRPLRRKRRSPAAPIDETATVQRAIENNCGCRSIATPQTGGSSWRS